MIALLSLMVAASTLHVGIVGDARVAKRALRELSAEGFRAQHCTVKDLACLDDDACRPSLIASCDVDAIVGVEAREESDGEWRRTIVVDGEGAVALSLDQPAEENVVVPAIAIETLRTMHARTMHARARDAPDVLRNVSTNVSTNVITEPASGGGGGGYPAVFWAGVIASGAGVVVTGAAVTLAGLAEAERAEPTTPAQTRVDAGERARLLWLGAAAGAVVAVTGAAAACANSDTRSVAPELRKWCIE